ncbi:MAG TPA: DUF397 domain-containing protein [Pseudonocardia sp.]|jgi:hypothetical protein|uniref:DUF397 domain-containing protein n=1 Tax=Pseudonocardia sp. TaxID=60912 RepID=UPI002F42C2A6
MAAADRPRWRTSSRTDNGEKCVEVAPTADGVLVRDTKDHGAGPVLRYSYREWAEFLAGPVVTTGEQLTRHDGTSVLTRWHLRDTLHFTTAEWDAFLAGARDGEFDFTLTPSR